RENGEGLDGIAFVDGAKFHDGQARSISVVTSVASSDGLKPNTQIPVDRAFCRAGVAEVNVKERACNLSGKRVCVIMASAQIAGRLTHR
ncbi:MAG: hypothetical protein Q7U92_09640, partial [Bradyrhizobium sp.]|nr:hypothetical protein [Bradyrhizobium sp.]